jgi:hypothetical protein
MMPSTVNYLPVEQQILIPAYQKKWEKIRLSTKRIDKCRAESAIAELYTFNKKPLPKFHFFASPFEALIFLLDKQNPQNISALMQMLEDLTIHILECGNMQKGDTYPLSGMFLDALTYQFNDTEVSSSIGKSINLNLIGDLINSLEDINCEELDINLWNPQPQFCSRRLELDRSICNQIEEYSSKQIYPQIKLGFQKLSDSSSWEKACKGIDSVTKNPSWKDDLQDCLKSIYISRLNTAYSQRLELENLAFINFYISVLGYNCNINLWNISQIIFMECDWFFPFENICLICDRPTKISFSVRHRLGKDAEPIMQFSDGFKVFE